MSSERPPFAQIVVRGIRVGAFTGLAISAIALLTGSDWLVKPLWGAEKEPDHSKVNLERLSLGQLQKVLADEEAARHKWRAQHRSL